MGLIDLRKKSVEGPIKQPGEVISEGKDYKIVIAADGKPALKNKKHDGPNVRDSNTTAKAATAPVEPNEPQGDGK